MATPSIEGTYQLAHRVLPDGTVKLPPDLRGILTYTKEVRNFSMYWKNHKGKFYSVCYVAGYQLTEKEYVETSKYLIIDDHIQGKGTRYDLSYNTAKSLVSFDGRRIRFDLPQPFEKALSINLEFDGLSLKATAKDLFTDYWEKVP